jgi:hypothetical protein
MTASRWFGWRTRRSGVHDARDSLFCIGAIVADTMSRSLSGSRTRSLSQAFQRALPMSEVERVEGDFAAGLPDARFGREDILPKARPRWSVLVPGTRSARGRCAGSLVQASHADPSRRHTVQPGRRRFQRGQFREGALHRRPASASAVRTSEFRRGRRDWSRSLERPAELSKPREPNETRRREARQGEPFRCDARWDSANADRLERRRSNRRGAEASRLDRCRDRRPNWP